MAKRIGFPEAVRAVAGANGANTMDVFAPCHRVIHTMGTVELYLFLCEYLFVARRIL